MGDQGGRSPWSPTSLVATGLRARALRRDEMRGPVRRLPDRRKESDGMAKVTATGRDSTTLHRSAGRRRLDARPRGIRSRADSSDRGTRMWDVTHAPCPDRVPIIDGRNSSHRNADQVMPQYLCNTTAIANWRNHTKPLS